MAFTKCTFLIDCAHKTIYYCLFTTIMAYEYLCCVYNITSIMFEKMRIRFIFLKTYYFISKVKSKRMSWIRCFEMMFVVRCNVNPCSSLQIQRWISLFSFSFNVFFTFICILFISFFLYIFLFKNYYLHLVTLIWYKYVDVNWYQNVGRKFCRK